MAYSEQTDKVTQRELNSFLNDKINTSRDHVDDPVPHISEEEREKLNALGSMGTATPSTNGLMSAEDKEKLDSIEANANNYIHPKSGVTAGTYIRTKVNDTGHVIAADNPTSLDITVTNSEKLGGLTSDKYMKKGETILQGDPQCPTPDGSNLMSVVNVNYLKLHYVPLVGNCTITGPITFNSSITMKGTPTAPTAAESTNNTQVATTAFTHTVVNSAKTALNNTINSTKTSLINTINSTKTSLTNTINSSISNLRTELKNEMSGNYVNKTDVSNTANHIPRYNGSGHLVLPSGIEIW